MRKSVSYRNVQNEIDNLVEVSEHLDFKTFELVQVPMPEMKPKQDGFKRFNDVLKELRATVKDYQKQLKSLENALAQYRGLF